MQIVDVVPLPDPGGGGARTIARFALKLTDDIKLCGLRLRQKPDGRFSIATPVAFGNASAHFAPDLFRQITDAAAAAYKGHHAIERRAV